MKKNIIIISLLFFAYQNKTYAHGENLARIYGHYTTSYDFTNYTNRFGLETNAYAVFFNAAIKYEYGAYNFDANHIGSFYAGIGLLNFIQFQVGYSTNKYYSLRLKSVWALEDIFIDIDNDILNNLSFGANIERAISNKQYKWMFSVGIGYRISSL